LESLLRAKHDLLSLVDYRDLAVAAASVANIECLRSVVLHCTTDIMGFEVGPRVWARVLTELCTSTGAPTSTDLARRMECIRYLVEDVRVRAQGTDLCRAMNSLRSPEILELLLKHCERNVSVVPSMVEMASDAECLDVLLRYGASVLPTTIAWFMCMEQYEHVRLVAEARRCDGGQRFGLRETHMLAHEHNAFVSDEWCLVKACAAKSNNHNSGKGGALCHWHYVAYTRELMQTRPLLPLDVAKLVTEFV